MTRVSLSLIVALSLGAAGLFPAGSAAADAHEKVLQVVTVRVEPGELDEYQKKVAKLSAVLERVGSGAVMRMWNTTQGGPDSGQILVALEYKNAAAWAADAPKVQGDSEWQDIIEDLHKIRTLEGSSMWREITPNPTAGVMKPRPGTVLVVTGVAVKPGKLDEYTKRLETGQAISDRLKLSGKLRIWLATLAGANTGNVAVGVESPSLAAYVADQAKLRADPEWRRLIGGLGDLRTLAGRWMYQEITP